MPETDTLQPEVSWYALWVRSRHEKLVAASLEARGLEPFLPLYDSGKRGADKKTSQLPLIPGYVFCRFEARNQLPVVTTPGVVSIVSAGCKPLPVDNAEIDALQKVMRGGLHARPWPSLTSGQKIRIVAGPLRDVEAIYVESRSGATVVITVTMLQRGIKVIVPRDAIERV